MATPLWGKVLGVAAIGGVAAWEAVRASDTHATVTSGWGPGVAAGAGAALALAVLFTPVLWISFRLGEPWLGGKAALVLFAGPVVLMLVAVVASLPPLTAGPDAGPYVVTSGVEVAAMAYVAAYLALLLVLLAVAPWIRSRYAPDRRRADGDAEDTVRSG